MATFTATAWRTSGRGCKRGLSGTYIAVEPFHLGAYVDEQVFRFNERKDADGGRFLKASAMVPTARLTYKELIRAEQA